MSHMLHPGPLLSELRFSFQVNFFIQGELHGYLTFTPPYGTLVTHCELFHCLD